MRPLELTLFLLDLACVVLPLLARPGSSLSRYSAWLAPLAGLALVAQLVVERYRWQLVPLYALTVVLLALRLPRMPGRGPDRAPRRTAREWAGGLGGAVALIVAAAPPPLFPGPVLPPPGGVYFLGT